MNTALNEACIGWLHEKFYFVRGVYLAGNLLLLCGILSRLQYFPQRFGRSSKTVHIWWRQQARLNEGGIFGKMIDIGEV